jgi:large subunit ribosomal protein L6
VCDRDIAGRIQVEVGTCFDVSMVPRPQWALTIRCFSSIAARTVKHYNSHIAKQPVRFPPTVTITHSEKAVSLVGPLGKTSVPLAPYMRITYPEPGTLSIAVEDVDVKQQRSMWGTTRTLIHNAVIGMTEGFSVPLYLVGVGYRAVLESNPRGDGENGQRLNMKLGFSHPIVVPIPSHIKAEVPLPTKIVISCNDKHLLGLFAARVRSCRKPEPYKGKVRLALLVPFMF